METCEGREICLTADDYGLTPGANEAIEDLAARGRISAVSVLAHRDADITSARRLADTGVAIGFHVCFTGERLLTRSRALGEVLPFGKARLFAAIAAKPWILRDLAREAEAQAERLAAAGAPISFVNGHEHVHLFPPIWPIVATIARQLGARAVRAALGQPLLPDKGGALALSSRLAWVTSPLPDALVMSPLGVGRAGAMTEPEIEAWLARPFAGSPRSPACVREIVMHPATDDEGRRAEHALIASGRVADLLAARGLSITRGLPLAR